MIGYIVLMISSDAQLNKVVMYFMTHTKVQLFNILFLLLIFLSLMAIFNTFWLASSFFLTGNLIIAGVNYEKVLYRSEGILPTDLTMIDWIEVNI